MFASFWGRKKVLFLFVLHSPNFASKAVNKRLNILIIVWGCHEWTIYNADKRMGK